MADLHSYAEGLESSNQRQEVTELVRVLEDKRDEAVIDRAETESRWLRDLQQFEGNTLDRMTKGDTDYRSAVRRAPPVIHLTRTRTLAIAARIINMVVPSNERSWDIEPTAVPEMVNRLQDTTPVMDPMTGQPAMVPDENAPPPQNGGEQMPPGAGMQPGMGPEGPPPQQPMRPVTQADLANMEKEEAAKRSRIMRKEMTDQLEKSRYNTEQRTIIMDGCKIGTGILEGPVVGGSYKKNRSQLPDGQWVTQMTDEPMPEYKAIDPWNFYPLPADHISRCEGVFIDQLMGRRELQELKMYPGFDGEMIDELLREEPKHSTKYTNSLVQRAQITGETQPVHKRYSIWKYTGSLDRNDLMDLGVDVDEMDIIDPIIEAWFVNTRLIKIKRHALEGEYRLPYYIWNYEKSETTMFGYGVPYFMRDSDRVIQSTWHMILHNAAMNAGPQLVRKKGAVEPADGSEDITGGLKQWYLTDEETRVEDVFQIFHIDSRLDELIGVHERARENADEELSFPLLAQGEPTEAVPTSSGMAMLLNASNVTQRRIAQSYDDDIIEPSISALYEYNMLYLDKPEAKGDMQIKPLGASKLVVKDMQAQHLLLIADITTNDRFAPLMKDDKLLRAILKAADVDAEEMMKSEEDLNNEGPSPFEQAELANMEADAMLKQAQARKYEADAAEGPEGLSEKDLAEQQFEYDKLEAQILIQEMKLQQAAMETAKSDDIKMADIEANFQIEAMKNNTKKMIETLNSRRKEFTEGYKAALDARELKMKERNLAKGYDTFG